MSKRNQKLQHKLWKYHWNLHKKNYHYSQGYKSYLEMAYGSGRWLQEMFLALTKSVSASVPWWIPARAQIW